VDQVMLKKVDVLTELSTTPILNSYKTIREKNFLSVPVTLDGQIYGFLDELDILHFSVERYHDLTNVTSAEVLNYSKLNPYFTISDNVNLIKLCESFCITHPGLQRIAVVDENEKFVGIVTQSKIVRFFAPHVKHFDFGNSSLEILGLGNNSNSNRSFITLKQSDSIHKALQTLYEEKANCLAIVSAKNNKLKGTFSASDLKYFASRPFKHEEFLNLTLKEFVCKSARLVPQVTKHSLCHEVVSIIDSQKLHHVFVTEHSVPVGLIFLSDIIELFWNHLIID